MGSAIVFKVILACFFVDACLSSSSSESGPAKQTCGPENYFCPADRFCKAGTSRCTNNEMCNYEPHSDSCLETDNGYTILLGHAHLNLFGSLGSKRTLPKKEHQFIQYRGFTYEFGKGYGIQILDINDPDYKYINDRGINQNGYDNVGSSYCTYDDIKVFLKSANKKYNLFTNNCQHFAANLEKYLKMDPCSLQQQTLRKRQDRNQQLQNNADLILTGCNFTTTTTDGAESDATGTFNRLTFITCILLIYFI